MIPSIKVSVAFALFALVGGCGTDDEDNTTGMSADELIALAESTCQKCADCVGEDSAWVENCSANAERQINRAEDYGCLDIMTDWFVCLDNNSKCTVDKEDSDKEDPIRKYTDGVSHSIN